MLGNHDTPPIWQLAAQWVRDGSARDRAKDLERRLVPATKDRERWVTEHTEHPAVLVHALFADLLVSRARSIMVFFADLLGLEEQYKSPGTVRMATGRYAFLPTTSGPICYGWTMVAHSIFPMP